MRAFLVIFLVFSILSCSNDNSKDARVISLKYRNGTRAYKGKNKNGYNVGVWEVNYPNGKPYLRAEYGAEPDEDILSERFFYTNGQIREEFVRLENSTDEISNYHEKFYTQNGVLTRLIVYNFETTVDIEGEEETVTTELDQEYYPNGVMYKATKTVEDEIQFVKWYDSLGVLQEEFTISDSGTVYLK